LRIDLYFDGNVINQGTEKAQGTASYLLIDKGSGKQKRETIHLGRVTNNEAEYRGLIQGLGTIKEGVRSKVDLKIFGDSKLVINQINRDWQTKSPQLRIYRDKVLDILPLFGSWEAIWVPREENLCT